ncbi:MAG: methyltransferase domain-containing protein, partial [Muribaculaceae bacterium]|nr:methyltransferase domain-containing protein [Muribaculaceae bacterium]
MQKVKPKKALGQHFLTDLRVAERIAATIDDYRSLPALEVGPGMGVLTRFLLERGNDVTVVEIDDESVEWLRTHFEGLKIVEGDFLRLDLAELMGGKQFT